MNTSSGELWYVKLADGDVHRVTLDQLDEAFQAGHIDTDTMVLASGASSWTTLGKAAGMDEDDDVPIEVCAPVHSAPTYVPQASAPSRSPYPAPQASARPAPYAAGSYAPPQSSPYAAPFSSYGQPQGSYGSRPVPAARPAYAPQSVPAARPAYSAVQPAYSTRAPQAVQGTPYGYAPAVRAPVPNSIRPFTLDSGDFDLEAAHMRRGSGGRWFVAVLAIAAIGGSAGVAVTRPSWAQPYLNRVSFLRAESPVDATVVAAAPPPAPIAPPPPVAVAPPTPPAPVITPMTTTATIAPVDSPLSPHFTDQKNEDPKLRLAATDRTNDVKPVKGHKGRGGVATVSAPHGSSSKAKSSNFTTGGSKFDPLNSSI